MNFKAAKKLVNEQMTKAFGFEVEINKEQEYVAFGVKTGLITPEQAAEKLINLMKI